MEISGAQSASPATTAAIEVQKKSQEVQAETAATLIQSVPDPDSSLGQTIDVNAWFKKGAGEQWLLKVCDIKL